jgi:pyruvate ferredoxin oxidoreductase alpha subunit
MDLADYFFEHKRQQAAAMEKALEVVPQVGEEFGNLTGRYYGLTEGYHLDDADFVAVALGSTTGTARIVVDELRAQGIKAGLLKLRCFRPFPASAVAQALGNKRAVAVLDRSLSFGAQGNPLFLEVVAALYTHGFTPKVVNYAYGMGGRDTVPALIHQVYKDLVEIDRNGLSGPPLRFLGVRE